MRKLRVGVICGGLGAERDVSFRTADAVLVTLRGRGHDAVPVVADRELDRALRKIAPDAAVIALHGRSGEEGSVQGLLETLRIPYTGPSLGACALAAAKPAAKAVLRQHNVNVPPHYLVYADAVAGIGERHETFGLPAFVKPTTGGLSLGVSVVHDIGDLEAACVSALRLADACLVERRVGGREIIVGLIGALPLGAVEMTSDIDYLDFRAKAGTRAVEYRAPRVAPDRLAGVLRLAARAATALGLDGAALVQVAAGKDDVVIGVTPLPPLVPDGPMALTAAQAGLGFDQLVLGLLGESRLRGHGARQDRRIRYTPFEGDERRAGLDPH